MKHLPNIMTIFRILLIPVFAFYAWNEQYLYSAAVVMISGLTDVADGFIARKFNFVSVTGQVLDPLADKLMQLSIIAILWAKSLIPDWAIAVMAGKEILMIFGGCILYFFKKKRSIPAKWYGKATTCMFYFTMLYIIIRGKSSSLLVSITVGAMIFSLIMYFTQFLKAAKKHA